MGKMNADQDFDLNIPDPQATILSGPARVGAELRSVREHLGWPLPDLAARLKIRLVFLEAIEAGNLSALPAPAYAAGFIRSYAEAMGLDPEEILRRFRAEGMSRPRQPRLSFPEPVPDRAVPPGAIIFLVAVIGIGGYFLWYRHSEHELKMAQMVPAVPAKLAPLAVPKSAPPPSGIATTSTTGTAADTSTSATGSAGTLPVTTGSAPAASPPSPSASTGTASDTGSTDAQTPTGSQTAAATPPGPPNTGSTAGTSGTTPVSPSATTASSDTTSGTGSARAASTPSPSTTAASDTNTSAPAVATAAGPLVIRATATSWVQVKDAKGTILFSRVLKAGQSWPVPDESGLTLTTGNAGGTVLVRKGVAGAPLGKDGVVLHDVPLTPPAGATAQ